MHFIYFSCLVVVASPSNTTLNKSGERQHPGPLNLRGKVLSFSALNMILAMGSSYMVFIMLKHVSSILILMRLFIINEYWYVIWFQSSNVYWDLFCDFTCDLSWRILQVYLRIMCILMLMDEMFYISVKSIWTNVYFKFSFLIDLFLSRFLHWCKWDVKVYHFLLYCF